MQQQPSRNATAATRAQDRATELSSVGVGLSTLRGNPMRTFLATLGVIIGVAALVAVLSLGDGMESFARNELSRTTDVQNVFINPRTADSIDGVEVPRQRFVRFTTADAQAAAREVPGIAGVGLSIGGTTLVTPPDGGRRRGARVTATLATAAEFNEIEIEEGRFFSEIEAERNVPVVVLSHTAAVELSRTHSPAQLLGRAVRVRGMPRTVVGIRAEIRGERGLGIFVPIRAAPEVMLPAEAQGPRTLLVKAPSVEQVPAVQERVEDWLATRYGRWDRDMRVETRLDRVEQMQQAFRAFKLFLGAIAAISLLVGGIGIMNVLLASVTERTREIGIRKAAGARRRDILLQFLAESVAISGSGSAIGLLLGLGIAFAAAAAMRASTQALVYAGVSWSTMAVAASSALIIGLSFGTYPARRAARLSPIDAIRHE
jgi:putative ABC transport system permease protein